MLGMASRAVHVLVLMITLVTLCRRVVPLGIVTSRVLGVVNCSFFFQAEDGIRDSSVTGVQTCALPIWPAIRPPNWEGDVVTTLPNPADVLPAVTPLVKYTCCNLAFVALGSPQYARLNTLVNSIRRLNVARSLTRKVRPKFMFSRGRR